MINITFHGHACFEIANNNNKLIVDPFIKGNPLTDIKPEDVKVDYILLTHGHGDHFGDTPQIAKNNDATVIAPFELATFCEQKGIKVHPMHIGGSFKFDFGKVKLTQALHGSAFVDNGDIIYTGNPCGFIIQMDDKTIYHAGDTGLFGDMALLGEMYDIDVALLPIGDNFVMGIDDAVKAVEFLKPKKVVPMHYNTFDVIKQDPEEFKTKAQGMAEVVILTPGKTLKL